MTRTGRAATLWGWGALAALTLLPVIALTTQALAKRWFFPDLLPDEWTTTGIRGVLDRHDTRSATIDSMLIGTIVTVLSMCFAIPAARALTIGRLRGTRRLGLAFLLPAALPPVALAMGIEVAFLRLGVTGGRAPVIMAHLVATLPYSVLLLTAALFRYDDGYERQAAALGAGRVRILCRVFLPLATPALVVTAGLTFVVSWSQYLLTLLPGGGRVLTLPVLLLGASGGGDPTAAAAIALVSALPPAVAILLVVRHLGALERSSRPPR